jgi:hypothetical protein
MHLKAATDKIVLSNQFTAPDYKGDDVEWVTYAYPGEAIAMTPGVEVTDDSYTKPLEDGSMESRFFPGKRFHKIEDVWYELLIDTVRKTVWDAEHEESEA